MNPNILMAKFAIAKSRPASTIELILSEIIDLHPDNIIHIPSELSPTICKTLHITPDLFRFNISKLYKLNILQKHGNTILVNPSVRASFKIQPINTPN